MPTCGHLVNMQPWQKKCSTVRVIMYIMFACTCVPLLVFLTFLDASFKAWIRTKVRDIWGLQYYPHDMVV